MEFLCLHRSPVLLTASLNSLSLSIFLSVSSVSLSLCLSLVRFSSVIPTLFFFFFFFGLPSCLKGFARFLSVAPLCFTLVAICPHLLIPFTHPPLLHPCVPPPPRAFPLSLSLCLHALTSERPMKEWGWWLRGARVRGWGCPGWGL